MSLNPPVSPPVSYTHLDVYKRQFLRLSTSPRDGRTLHRPPVSGRSLKTGTTGPAVRNRGNSLTPWKNPQPRCLKHWRRQKSLTRIRSDSSSGFCRLCLIPLPTGPSENSKQMFVNRTVLLSRSDNGIHSEALICHRYLLNLIKKIVT